MANVRNSAGINKGGQGAKNVNPLYQSIKSATTYVGNVAREVRDIPTAIGTVTSTNFSDKNPNSNGPSIKNLIKQVKEVGTAATTGKKGTTSDIVPMYGPKIQPTSSGTYTKGKKRN